MKTVLAENYQLWPICAIQGAGYSARIVGGIPRDIILYVTLIYCISLLFVKNKIILFEFVSQALFLIRRIKNSHLDIATDAPPDVIISIFQSYLKNKEKNKEYEDDRDAKNELLNMHADMHVYISDAKSEIDFIESSKKLALIASSPSKIDILPIGIEHGTVIVVCDGVPMEITTLREDVICDGRHAEIRFINDWERDAARRDLTINAIYIELIFSIYISNNREKCIHSRQECLTLERTKALPAIQIESLKLHDYRSAISDLCSGAVHFIGDSSIRIKEDYLRMMRYCRFLSYVGYKNLNNHEIEDIIKNSSCIKHVSEERVVQELSKMLVEKYCCYAINIAIHLNLIHFSREKLKSEMLFCFNLFEYMDCIIHDHSEYISELRKLSDLDKRKCPQKMLGYSDRLIAINLLLIADPSDIQPLKGLRRAISVRASDIDKIYNHMRKRSQCFAGLFSSICSNRNSFSPLPDNKKLKSTMLYSAQTNDSHHFAFDIIGAQTSIDDDIHDLLQEIYVDYRNHGGDTANRISILCDVLIYHFCLCVPQLSKALAEYDMAISDGYSHLKRYIKYLHDIDNQARAFPISAQYLITLGVRREQLKDALNKCLKIWLNSAGDILNIDIATRAISSLNHN